ncbi:uncharacterized protein [Palaemon carinicauda]|uniref:uncharacterized protein n=1 Tax=Palaemon carinicauda TaxID=392227 RepID=UPI0035B57E93
MLLSSMNFLKLAYVLLVCTITTSGKQDETTMSADTASTYGDSELSSTQHHISDEILLGFPSVTSSQNGREVSAQGTTGNAERAKTNTTEQESGEETGNNQGDHITLSKTVVSVVLVLLLSTSVLHFVFILHYCMKIWYCCCTQEVESNVDYSQMSVFGLTDLSNRSSLNKASIKLRNKGNKLDVDAETTFQNYSYRCNSNYNDGFLNLDNAINKGRHSKRISFVNENEQCRKQSQTRSLINSPSKKETAAEVHPERDDISDKCSMIVPSIQMNSPEEQGTGIGTSSSDTESVETPSQVISSKKCALPFNDQVMGSDNEIASRSTIPIKYPVNMEDSGVSLSLRELNSMKKQLEKHMEGPSEVEKRKPGLSGERQNSTLVVNASKRAVSAGYSMHLTEERDRHKRQQLEARRFSSFEPSIRANYQSHLQIPSYMNKAAGENKRHYFLHCGGPETSV